MPFPMKIQPIDSFEQPIRSSSNNNNNNDSAAGGKPPVLLKSRIKRFFDRPFPSVLRISSTTTTEKLVIGGCGGEQLPPPPTQCNKDGASEFEPSSVCLAKMVKDFMEESNEKPSSAAAAAAAAVKCGRNRCNCFNGNNNDSSDDEFDVFGSSGDLITSGSHGDAAEILKSLIPCATAAERNLLADTAKIIDNNKIYKRKDDMRKVVTENLSALGYTASICKSRWDKTPSYPAGEYEYIDATVGGERLLIDIDFRSEFEIARSTSNYKAVLQALPYIFVGKPDRLQQIVSIISEAAKQSLTKKGMHFPPWRKAEYMRAKWLSPYTRTTTPPPSPSSSSSSPSQPSFSSKKAVVKEDEKKHPSITAEIESGGELELIFGELTPPSETDSCGNFSGFSPAGKFVGDDEKKTPVVMVASPWQPPAIKPRSCDRGARVVTGLASLLTEKL